MNHQSGVSFGTDEVGLHSLRGVGNTNDFASLCDDSGSTPTRTSRNPYSLGNRDRFRSDRQEGFRRVAMSSQFFSAEQNHHTAWDVAGAATQGVFRVTTVPPSGESSRIAKHTAASNDVDTHSSSQTRTAHASSSSSLCGSSGRGTGHLEKIANENVEETERVMRSSAPKSSQGYELDDAFDVAYRDLQSSTSPSSTLIGKNQAVLCQKKTTEVVEEDEFDF